MVTITFIRHGNTDENQKRILQGQSDTLLNELGHQQAALARNRLINDKFDMIYCSDLLRCQQTAQAIREHHQDIPITFLASLRERSFGDLSGQSLSHLFSESHRLKLKVDDFVKAHGGESEPEFAERVIDAYHSLVRESTQAGYQHILVVTHGGPLRSLCFWWTSTSGIKYQYDGDRDRLRRGHHGNTGITKVRVLQDNPATGIVELFSCSDHLNCIGPIDDIPPSV